MRISKAELNEYTYVSQITHETIKTVYPKYYPPGAIKYSIKFHTDEEIIKDIKDGKVYILQLDNGEYAGTVTVDGNEIKRLYVLPQYQGNGRALMDHAEMVIAHDYNEAILESSLPAKSIYRNRGYIETDYRIAICENGDYICYDVMRKDV